MKRDGNREEEVIRKYKACFEQGSIRADVEELRKKTLLCHCDRDQAWSFGTDQGVDCELAELEARTVRSR